MKDDARRQAARQAAQEYAPRPESGLAMYAAVGIVLSGLALLLFGRFYDIDMLTHPLWAFGLVGVVFAGAICLWLVRSRRHKQAHRIEYDRKE